MFIGNRTMEGNDPDDYSRLTYRKLLEEVCRFANVLKSKGVTKGDRVAIYMPMILELPIAMLACTRIGAVHSVVVKNCFFFFNAARVMCFLSALTFFAFNKSITIEL
ncbi:hypothetical protein E2986_10895 [Frieseomelitta varia]|uniref:acetate--CoA ligase n=1 Tax=Frieseomelitta varia TaxID=561572 RepID=A0A833S410_9HYME|nr:hypothetical protein E2986_10895 [Frieseomelitta varia]